MPLLLLLFFIADLLSFAYPIIAYYLWREWHKYHYTIYDDYAHRCLYGAIALLVFIILGKFLIKLLLSKSRKGEDEPHILNTKKSERIIRPDGSIINVEYYGREDGQAIIFIHGLNANIKNWYYQIKYFEKSYRLIMMDMAGMGKSTRPRNKDFSLIKMANDLKAVIAYTNAKNPILWGHSMGGMTILTLLTKLRSVDNPSIKGVILEHTTYTNPVKTMIFSKVLTAIQKPVLVPLCWIIIILSPLIWISRWLSYFNGNAHIFTRWLTFAGTQTSKQLDFSTLLSTMTPPAIMARGCLGMFHYDVTKELPTIEVPALIISANKDRLTKPTASWYMKAHMPNAELKEVAPGNHQGLIERHKDVNLAASQFINSVTAK
jgi:Predicted hydrolases or acyltransferases (alpha/beta hydrolase superfamily)